MSKILQFGHPAWLEHVFGSPGVRSPKGRSYPANRIAPNFSGQVVHLEGYEPVAAYALEYLIAVGVVRRWKSQPFFWLPKDAPEPRAPDFLVELFDRTLLIVQSKSSKYLTGPVQAEFDAERETAAKFNIKHTVWTERSPFNAAARDNLLRLRASRNYPHRTEDVDGLLQLVQRGNTTLDQVMTAGFEPALVFILAARGQIHFNYLEKLNAESRIAPAPLVDGYGLLLGSGVASQGWWNSLPRC